MMAYPKKKSDPGFSKYSLNPSPITDIFSRGESTYTLNFNKL